MKQKKKAGLKQKKKAVPTKINAVRAKISQNKLQ